MDEIKGASGDKIIAVEDSAIHHQEKSLLYQHEKMLADLEMNLPEVATFSMPIAEVSALGSAVASILPSFRTITETKDFQIDGLYRLANMGVGDTLKMAKNGNYWGAFNTSEGASKMLQIQKAEPFALKTASVAAINPTMVLVAVALYRIEKQLKNIAELQKEIISFLVIEKESEIEADVQMLGNIINQYKFNWDNEHYVASNHKLVIDIQRTARKNINAYQKLVMGIMKKKQPITAQSKVNSLLNDLLKKVKYYRLSIYAFSLSSMLEVMLSGNFKEDYILAVKAEIESLSKDYRNIYTECSTYLEKKTGMAIERNLLKGAGIATGSVGKLIGKIPLIEKGPVDEFLQEQGKHIEENADIAITRTVESFATVKDPSTWIFSEKLDDMLHIYNHTEQIYFDKENIYLLSS